MDTEAPETTGTPTDEALDTEAPSTEPEGSQTDSPDIDWEQRYNDLRPEADRRQSVIADIEGRNGPDAQREALAQYARIEVQDEEEEPEPDDEFDLPPDPSDEIAEIKQQLAERDEAAEAAEFEKLEQEYAEETIGKLEDDQKLDLNDDEYDYVESYGFNHRDSHDGRPDFEGGLAKLKAIQQSAAKRYTDSKKSDAPPVGTAGEQKIDLRDKEARQKLGIEAFEAAERSKED